MKEINKGTRIINFIIDIIVIGIISRIMETILDFNSLNIVFYTVYVIYYFIFEAYNGRTIGKLITGTIVVDMDNLKPSVGRIALRTILRLNPFDGISYLFGQEQGGHDLISKTRLIVKK